MSYQHQYEWQQLQQPEKSEYLKSDYQKSEYSKYQQQPQYEQAHMSKYHQQEYQQREYQQPEYQQPEYQQPEYQQPEYQQSQYQNQKSTVENAPLPERAQSKPFLQKMSFEDHKNQILQLLSDIQNNKISSLVMMVIVLAFCGLCNVVSTEMMISILFCASFGAFYFLKL